MIQKRFALFFLLSAAWAQAQSGTMTVVMKDGTRHPFRLADVARIEMGDPAAAPTPAPATSAARPFSFNGAWDVKSSSGWTARFTLKEAGATATGNYANPTGRIAAQLLAADRGTLSGYWYQSESGQKCTTQREGTYYWGKIVLRLSNNDGFTGWWDYCGTRSSSNPHGEYSGTRAQ